MNNQSAYEILLDAMKEIIEMADNRPKINMPDGTSLASFGRIKIVSAGQAAKEWKSWY